MMGRPSKSMTAAELLAQLAVDPDHQRMAAERSAADADRERELRDDQRPIVEELRAGGVRIKSVWDLIDAGALPADAVTTLIRHLGRPRDPRTRDGIARALGAAAPADRDRVSSALRGALAHEQDQAVRDAILLAIGQVAGPDDLESLVGLLRDPRAGDARVMLLFALARYGEPGRAVLAAACEDPFLGPEATRQLRAASRGRQATLPAADLVDAELVSVALDRDQLPRFLLSFAAALGVPASAVEPIRAGANALVPEDATTLTVDTGNRAVVTVELFGDDVDAIDVIVRGPARYRPALERMAENLLQGR